MQTTIVNRLAYANYIEGRNIDVKLILSITSTNPYIEIQPLLVITDVVDYSNVIDLNQLKPMEGNTGRSNEFQYQ
jgi:hypothetical protein